MSELTEWRITKLEEGYLKMEEALQSIVAEVRLGKWVVAFAFGILQPVLVGTILYIITKG